MGAGGRRRGFASIVIAGAAVALIAPASPAAQVAQGESARPAICRYDPDCPDVVDTSGIAAEATPSPTPTPSVAPTETPVVAPAVVANGPARPPNPLTARALAIGFVVVSQATALVAPVYVFPTRATHHRAIAPHTTSTGLSDGRILFRVGLPARMVVNVPAATTFDIRIRVRGRWHALGAAVSDDRGWLSLPVVATTRPGSFLVSMFDTARGDLYYVKLRVRA